MSNRIKESPKKGVGYAVGSAAVMGVTGFCLAGPAGAVAMATHGLVGSAAAGAA